MSCLIHDVMILVLFLLPLSCSLGAEGNSENVRDYREDMRLFVQDISGYARKNSSGFIIIPQNGQEIISSAGETDSPLKQDYLNAIDGCGREDLFYGYSEDNKKTPSSESEYMLRLCRVFQENGKTVLTTDYCSDTDKMDDSSEQNQKEGFISFAAPRRDLTVIPDYPLPVFEENSEPVRELREARNFLYLINSENYSDKDQFLDAVADTNFDMVIVDLFHNEDPFTEEELIRIKYKKNGGKRLLICYMSIGEAEDYRYYWNSSWKKNPPSWLEGENPDWEGNYKVRYWYPEWQNLIFGSPASYLDRILEAGFDGVYLDIIDGFEYFE